MVALRNLAVLALVLALQGHASRVESSAQLTAQAWLRAHDDPDLSGLDELKTTNPDSFAIVQALMAKRSLGLLDPKHPITSMRSAPSQDASGFGGAAAEAAAAQPVAEESEAPAEADPSPHKNFFNWKPANSAADDDAMVKSVLGAAAGAEATGKSAAVLGSSNTAIEMVPADLVAPQQQVAAAPPAQVAAIGTGSFSSLIPDWGVKSNPVASAAAPLPAAASTNKASDYMSELGLGKVNSVMAPAPVTAPAQRPSAPSGNALASFSWDSLVQKQAARTVTTPNVEDEVKKERQMDVYIHDGFGKAEQADAKHEKEVNANKNLKA